MGTPHSLTCLCKINCISCSLHPLIAKPINFKMFSLWPSKGPRLAGRPPSFEVGTVSQGSPSSLHVLDWETLWGGERVFLRKQVLG